MPFFRVDYIIHSLKNLGDFSGRANRAEFWYYMLFVIFMNFIVFAVSMALASQGVSADSQRVFDAVIRDMGLINIFACLSLCIRRFHDIGHTGCLIILLAFPFAIIVLGCVRGDCGPNGYGPPFDPETL
ncbi:MAG: DUF805 domain-containing protein [Deltaproteobacteria bacterium]|jgi:uncharacterized membrane protein YhaH (DUF805 family)|nr:DUF805 domain-containing protein [Deltaproteobacteria bacterium]